MACPFLLCWRAHWRTVRGRRTAPRQGRSCFTRTFLCHWVVSHLRAECWGRGLSCRPGIAFPGPSTGGSLNARPRTRTAPLAVVPDERQVLVGARGLALLCPYPPLSPLPPNPPSPCCGSYVVHLPIVQSLRPKVGAPSDLGCLSASTLPRWQARYPSCWCVWPWFEGAESLLQVWGCSGVNLLGGYKSKPGNMAYDQT